MNPLDRRSEIDLLFAIAFLLVTPIVGKHEDRIKGTHLKLGPNGPHEFSRSTGTKEDQLAYIDRADRLGFGTPVGGSEEILKRANPGSRAGCSAPAGAGDPSAGPWASAGGQRDPDRRNSEDWAVPYPHWVSGQASEI